MSGSVSARASVEGIGLVGPGLDGWPQAREVLCGHVAYEPARTRIPSPAALPPVERRRAGIAVRIALAAGLEAAAATGRAARDMAAVFTSSGGDGENVHAICEMLASDDRMISPTRFHNSVHNAPSGYWGIATGSPHPADSIAAFDASFGAGLVEAMSRIVADPEEPVLLIAYDAPYPEPLNAARWIPDAFAVALALVAPTKSRGGVAISITADRRAPEILEDPRLERLRRAIPAARSLPLLRLLACGHAGRTTIDYPDGVSLTVERT